AAVARLRRHAQLAVGVRRVAAAAGGHRGQGVAATGVAAVLVQGGAGRGGGRVGASGLSRYRIAKQLGVSESLLSRFMAGRWLGHDPTDALADLLGLNVTTEKHRRKKG